jgi:hypothetical protein
MFNGIMKQHSLFKILCTKLLKLAQLIICVHSDGQPSTIPTPDNGLTSKPLLTKALQENARLELCRELELGMKTRELLPKVFLDEL